MNPIQSTSINAEDDDEPYDQLNIVPMLDIAFVLIIIFIVMATATVAGIRLDLPQASESEPLAAAETQAISVTATGDIYLNGIAVSLSELDAELRRYYAFDPEVPVVIRGDSAAAYGVVVEVIDVLKTIGITKIGLPTERREG